MADTNTNNNENLRANLSEMDKIFIPHDLDDNVTLDDLANYKICNVKFWRSVPENYRLVKVNRITQKITSLKGFGLKFVPPLFVKTILVPAEMLEGKKSYNSIECLTSDKIEASIDLSIMMSITDPTKYKRKGATQLEQLNSIISRLLRTYVARKSFDVLNEEECQINTFDPNRQLETFENECGIKVNKVIFEKVKLPERLKKLYNDAAEEEQRRKAQTIKLEAEKDKAKTEAQITEIKAEAEAKKIRAVEEAKTEVWMNQMTKFVEYLEAKGINSKDIVEQLKIKLASEGNSFVSIGESNGIASSIAAGIQASKPNKTQPQSIKQPKVTNSQKLINDAQALLMFGNITNERYNAIINLLTRPEYKQQIDNCSSVVYQTIVSNLVNGEPRNEQSQSQSHRR